MVGTFEIASVESVLGDEDAASLKALGLPRTGTTPRS